MLPVREFEIAFSLWQQDPETWITLKSAASRAAGGRLCTNSKALVILHIFNNCQINKKINEICICLRTVNLACWNVLSPLCRGWTFLFEISSVSFQKAVTSVKHFSFKWTPEFFTFICYKSMRLSIGRKTKWDKIGDPLLWLAFYFYFTTPFSPNCSGLKMTMLAYAVETDEKHGYSIRKPLLVHTDPVCLDFWWPYRSVYWYRPGGQWSCMWPSLWIVWMSIMCEWYENMLYEWDLNTLTFAFLNSCYRINTLQQTSCSP